MRNHEPGKSGARQLTPQRDDAAEVIHPLSCNTVVSDQWSGNREQRTEDREQRTENREQRTEKGQLRGGRTAECELKNCELERCELKAAVDGSELTAGS
jgi:hypothetical protein